MPEITKPELELHITGPEADEIAAELTELVSAELGVRPDRRFAGAPVDHGARFRSADPLTVTALVLAVPSAILAAHDLARRVELKAKLDRLLDWARRRHQQSPHSRIELVPPEGRSRPLDEVESAEVIEIAMQVEIRITRRSEKR